MRSRTRHWCGVPDWLAFPGAALWQTTGGTWRCLIVPELTRNGRTRHAVEGRGWGASLTLPSLNPHAILERVTI